MNPKIKLLLVDDLQLVRQGLCMLLGHDDTIEIVGAAGDGYEALYLVNQQVPDVVITDIQMPDMDGVALTKELKKTYPQLPVIAITQFKEDHLIVDMLEAGAKGYLLKTADKEQLLEAIHAVYAGGWYYCNSTSLKLVRLIATSQVEIPRAPEASQFSEKEMQIIQLICQEYSTREIAAQVFLGERTIESYRHKIFEKMGVKNMAGLAIYATRFGLYKA